MKDNMHRSHSHHKRKHYVDEERESRRKHKKHSSHVNLSDIEVIDNREEQVPDVIEIHGSSSEEGEISDSDQSKVEETVHVRRKHKHSRRHKEKNYHREKEQITSDINDRSKESHRHCKKHRRRNEADHNDDKRQKRNDTSEESSHQKRRKEKRQESNRPAIKQEPNDQDLNDKTRLKVLVKEERGRSTPDVPQRGRSRERVPAEPRVKEEASYEDEPDIGSNPGTSSGVRRPRVEDNTEYDWGGESGQTQDASVKKEPEDKDKPDFKLSGKLTEDRNMFNGVVIKYSEPPESRMPKKRWRLYPFKGEQVMPTMYIHRQSAYLIGRDRKVADLPIDHPSCSKQHAALQYRLVSYNKRNGLVGKAIRLYIIDLESANGTFVNNKKIESKKYVELLEKDVIKFGFSSREYVLLHEGSKGDDSDNDS